MKPSCRVILAAACLLISASSACHAQLWNTSYQFVPSEGYYNGGEVRFLMTDCSNAAYALAFQLKLGMPVNFSPKLAYCLNPLLRTIYDLTAHAFVTLEFMPSIYYVTNFDQDLIFSAQWPVPPPPATLQGGEYEPLWRLKTVTWVAGTPEELESVADITGAGANVTVTDVGVVVGASIIINTTGAKIPQATVYTKYGYPLVRLPVRPVYVDGTVYKTVQLDFSDQGAARVNKGNWAPWLKRFAALRVLAQPLASQDIYNFWRVPPTRQLYVASEVPSPFGYTNANADYSPLVQEWAVDSLPVSTIYTSVAQIYADSLKVRPTGYMNYEPVVGP